MADGRARLWCLRHVNEKLSETARMRPRPYFGKATFLIQAHVLHHSPVCIETDLGKTKRNGALVSKCQKRASIAAALMFGPDSNAVDQQAISHDFQNSHTDRTIGGFEEPHLLGQYGACSPRAQASELRRSLLDKPEHRPLR